MLPTRLRDSLWVLLHTRRSTPTGILDAGQSAHPPTGLTLFATKPKIITWTRYTIILNSLTDTSVGLADELILSAVLCTLVTL